LPSRVDYQQTPFSQYYALGKSCGKIKSFIQTAKICLPNTSLLHLQMPKFICDKLPPADKGVKTRSRL
jgi:hypothetical protein